MAKRDTTGDLDDPRTGGRAIRVERLRLDGEPCDPARTNCFAVYRIESGAGTAHDFTTSRYRRSASAQSMNLRNFST